MKDYHIFTLRLEHEMHDKIYNLAHILHNPMAEIIREGIMLRLDGVKKPLTNVDSAI